MTFIQLIYFKAVAEYGTLVKAAEALYISQSALSKAIKELEEELESDLFVRSGKGLVINEYGKKLLELSDSIIEQIGDIKPEIKKIKGLKNEIIAADTYYPFTYDVLCPMLLNNYKNVKLELQLSERAPEAIFKEIYNGKLDCALIGLTEQEYINLCADQNDNCVEHLLLFTDQLYLAVPKDNNVYKNRNIKLNEIVMDRLITSIKVGHTDIWFQSLMKKKNVSLEYRHIMDQDTFLKVWPDFNYDFITNSVWISNEQFRKQFRDCKTLIKIDETEAKEKVIFLYNKEKKFIPPLKEEIIFKLYKLFRSKKW